MCFMYDFIATPRGPIAIYVCALQLKFFAEKTSRVAIN